MKKMFYDSISEYKSKIRRNINKIKFDISYNLENLFLIDGNNLKEIKINKLISEMAQKMNTIIQEIKDLANGEKKKNSKLFKRIKSK